MFYAHLEPFEIFGKKSYRLLRPPFASRALRARAGEGVKNWEQVEKARKTGKMGGGLYVIVQHTQSWSRAHRTTHFDLSAEEKR